jgi:hypothetical protein
MTSDGRNSLSWIKFRLASLARQATALLAGSRCSFVSYLKLYFSPCLNGSRRRNECAKIPMNWSIPWVEVMAKRDKRWAPSDDERLLKFSDAGTPLPAIAITLGRTRPAVERRLAALRN